MSLISPLLILGMSVRGVSGTSPACPGSGSAYVAATGLVRGSVVLPSLTVRVTLRVPVFA